MKINKRGRAKYKPMNNIDRNIIKQFLEERISKEQTITKKNANSTDLSNIIYVENKMNLISLFSGCGGLDLGTEISGLDTKYGKNTANDIISDMEIFLKKRKESIFHTIFSIDNFKEANETYKINFPKHVIKSDGDIRKIQNFPQADIVLGGFPCPGFSEGGPRLIDDERNFLYLHFIRCLLQSKPFFFIAENVKGMLTLGGGTVAEQIKEDFSSAGYKVQMKLTNAKDYGVPQSRQRVFLVGVRNDLDFEYSFPEPTHGIANGKTSYITLRQAIGELENNPGDWYEGSFSPIFLSRNRKKTWDDQSFTIQASGRQAPLHPSGEPMVKLGKDLWELPGGIEKHRRLSVKEIARIQTFPDWFAFSSGSETRGSNNNKLNKIYKQIGNAVPVELARAILAPIAEWSTANIDALMKLREFDSNID